MSVMAVEQRTDARPSTGSYVAIVNPAAGGGRSGRLADRTLEPIVLNPQMEQQ